MQFEVSEIGEITPSSWSGTNKLEVTLYMTNAQLIENLAVMCEQLGDDEFLKEVNKILGVE